MNMLSRASKEPDVASLTPTVLSLKNVTLQYRTGQSLITASYRVSFEVHRGDRFILLGASGCGKSSLLKAVGGFLAPAEGTIKLNGKPVEKPGPDRMMVFQEFDQLMPWKTVEQNVAFPMLQTGRWSRKEALERAKLFTDKVNLSQFRESYPHMLSGGMKQRVAIARAMAMEPEILLMDEPFAALDALTRRKMQDDLLQLWSDTRSTIVFVTHSIEEAVIIGSRILVLTPHPGQVRAEINSHHLSFADQGSNEFGSLCSRINNMLFTPCPRHPQG